MLSSKLFLIASALTLAGLAASVPASADTFDFSLLDGNPTTYLCGRLTCHAFNWYQGTTEVIDLHRSPSKPLDSWLLNAFVYTCKYDYFLRYS